jgi:hypothetical protein
MYNRSAVPEFTLANKIYVNAQVTFYTVDANGNRTTTKADLYAEPTGTKKLPNPQVMDSFGKFKVPVYVDQAVIGLVLGLGNTPGHETGIIAGGDGASAAETFALQAEASAVTAEAAEDAAANQAMLAEIARVACENFAQFMAAPLPFLSSRAFAFDATGAAITTNGAKLQAILNNVLYPAFTLILDTPGGKYRFGDVSVDDNGKTYQVWGLGGGNVNKAPTELLMTIDAAQRDHIRVRANDVKWINVSINGETTSAPTYSPSFFVVGYNGGNGTEGRRFTLTGTVWNTPGVVVDLVQGNGPCLDVRGSGGWKPLIRGRTMSGSGPYKGGDDQQNGNFNIQVTRWKDWVGYGETGSSFGSHYFQFYKQYDCANGWRNVIGGNRALMFYSEYTRINTDNTPKDPPGIPYESPEAGENMAFSGGTDDCNWLNDQGLGQTITANGVFMSKAQNFGSIFTNLPTQRVVFYKPGAAAHHSLIKSASDGNLLWGISGTNNSVNITYRNTQNSGARVRLIPNRLGYEGDTGDGTSQVFTASQKRSGGVSGVVELTHVSDNTTSIAAGNRYAVNYEGLPNVSIGDELLCYPAHIPPVGITYVYSIVEAGKIRVDAINYSGAAVPGPIRGNHVMMYRKVVLSA